MTSWPTTRRVGIRDLGAAKERNERWAMLTAYDATTASIFDRSGVKVLLVGDSAAMTMLGHPTTLPITMDQMLVMAAAVVRATSSVLVVGDLPFGSYQQSVEQAVVNAARFFKEAGVGAVKLEGGRTVAPQVAAVVNAGMPVMGHVGLTPQSVHAMGGVPRVQGRGDAASSLLDDAEALQDAGAFAVVVEGVPADLGSEITARLNVPTIGIGAGKDCDAQVLVWQDMAGMTRGHVPKFVKQYADLGAALSGATEQFVREVQTGAFPGPQYSYE